VALGAGRDRVDAGVNHAVGIEVVAPVGAAVRAGDAVLVIACAEASRVAAARGLLDQAIEIRDTAPAPRPLVIATVR